MKLMRLLAAAAALGAATAAHAHGVWLADRAGALTVVYGVGPQDEAYRPDKVTRIEARAADGTPLAAKLAANGRNVIVEAPREAASFATTLDNGFWTKGPDGKFRNVRKSEVPDAQSASHTVKFNTHVRASTGGAPKPFGLTLEIVPLVDVHPLTPGDELPVQVLFEGKPLKGAALFVDYVNDANTRGAKTDADGKATLKVRNDGLNVIGVAFSQPTPDDKDADKIGYFATLSFVTAFVEND
ncbi:DUF4198 domain-containing protein [Terrarubrum flagellatum]|uniref:DUF4198 domain-containing protein n=1 Tax=Terrirubrum flagellatum TaxID=2895980 RepID=UPI003144F830